MSTQMKSGSKRGSSGPEPDSKKHKEVGIHGSGLSQENEDLLIQEPESVIFVSGTYGAEPHSASSISDDSVQTEPCQTESLLQDNNSNVLTPQIVENLQLDMYEIFIWYIDEHVTVAKVIGSGYREASRHYNIFANFSNFSGQEFNKAAIRQRVSALTLIEIDHLRRLISEDNSMLLRIKKTFPEANNRLNEIEKIIPTSGRLAHPLLPFHANRVTTIAERISLNSGTLDQLGDLAENKSTIERYDCFVRDLHQSKISQRFTGRPSTTTEQNSQLPLHLHSSPWDKCLINCIACEPPRSLSLKYVDLCGDIDALRLRESSHAAAIYEIAKAEAEVSEKKTKLLSEIKEFLVRGIRSILTADRQLSSEPEDTSVFCQQFSQAFDVPDNAYEMMSFTEKLKWCIEGDIFDQKQNILRFYTAHASYCTGRKQNYKEPTNETFKSSEKHSFPQKNSPSGRIFEKIANELIDEYDPSRLWLPKKLSEIESKLSGISSTEVKDDPFSRAKILLVNAGVMVSELELSIHDEKLLTHTVISDDVGVLRQVQRYFPEAEDKLEQLCLPFALNPLHPIILNDLNFIRHALSDRINGDIEFLKRLEKGLRCRNEDCEPLPEPFAHKKSKLGQKCTQSTQLDENNGHKVLAEVLFFAMADKSVEETTWLLDDLCYRISMYNGELSRKMSKSCERCAKIYQSIAMSYEVRAKKICPRLLNHYSNLLALRAILYQHGEDPNQTIDQARETMISHTSESNLWATDEIYLQSVYSSILHIPCKILDRLKFCSKLLNCIIGNAFPENHRRTHARSLHMPETGKPLIGHLSLKKELLAWEAQQCHSSGDANNTGALKKETASRLCCERLKFVCCAHDVIALAKSVNRLGSMRPLSSKCRLQIAIYDTKNLLETGIQCTLRSFSTNEHTCIQKHICVQSFRDIGRALEILGDCAKREDHWEDHRKRLG